MLRARSERTMGWTSVFFSADGRLGQGGFILGAGLLILGGVLSHLVPGLGLIYAVVSFYAWICLLSKRLHDMGRSGWLQAAPFLLGWTLMAAGGGLGAASVATLLASAPSLRLMAAGAAAAGLVAVGLFIVGGTVHLLLLIWVALSPGQRGFNRYGPPPGEALV